MLTEINLLKCVLSSRQDVDVSALKPSWPSRQHRHHPHHPHPYSSDQRHLAPGCQFPSYPFPSSYQSSVSNAVLFLTPRCEISCSTGMFLRRHVYRCYYFSDEFLSTPTSSTHATNTSVTTLANTKPIWISTPSQYKHCK